MSKSAASASGLIEIMDAPEINVKKIKSAVTDTGREVIYDEKNKPGISNLMTIYSIVTAQSIEAIEKEFSGKGYGDFKGAVADATVEFLRPIRERALELLQNEDVLIAILNKGADKAKLLASKTLRDAYQALGILG